MAQSLTYGAQTGAQDTVGGSFARFVKKIADYRLFRATILELSRLTDRDLQDLGVHRSSIREIAYDSVYGA